MKGKLRVTSRRLWKFIPAFLCLISAAVASAAGQSGIPLPEDRGTAGIVTALRRLPVFARVLYVTAHPDDEGAGTLVWLARKAGAKTALFSFTRGDGGQNVLGDEKYEAMGLLRTGELLEACRIYGTELYFASRFDFGFSKTAEETFSKWEREETLEELVRFIRRWRPTVIISRFQGNEGDGHGHHQAAGAITHEAFRAAGDPGRFAEHIRQGLPPWQARSLYHGRVSAEAAASGLVRVPVGDHDPVLGRSYREIGSEGYGKHRSQGMGAAFSTPGRATDAYELVEGEGRGGAEETAFLGLADTSLQAIRMLAGEEMDQVGFLQESLAEVDRAASSARALFRPEAPELSAPDVARGLRILTDSAARVARTRLSAGAGQALRQALQQKLEEFYAALHHVLGVHLVGRADTPTATPSDKVEVSVDLYNRGSRPILLQQVTLNLRPGWSATPVQPFTPRSVSAGESASVRWEVSIPPDASVTEPYYRRKDFRAAKYDLGPTEDPFAPFGSPELSARATYGFDAAEAVIERPVLAQAPDPIRGMEFVDFQIVPAVSVSVSPALAIVPRSGQAQTREFRIAVTGQSAREAKGSVRLVLPEGWRAGPDAVAFTLSRKGESFSAAFQVQMPPDAPAGEFPVKAVATLEGRQYNRGYRVIAYPQNWTRHVYSPAQSLVRILDVKVRPGLTVGYVMGAGDEVPAALGQLGVEVEMLTAEQLSFGDLDRFNAIVTGIRAYNVSDDLVASNRRLLEYVHRG
ncbi:MAG: PIG-L family deacetylase, partial [Acidobacteriota bacterium]